MVRRVQTFTLMMPTILRGHLYGAFSVTKWVLRRTNQGNTLNALTVKLYNAIEDLRKYVYAPKNGGC